MNRPERWLDHWLRIRDTLVSRYAWSTKQANKFVIAERLWFERRKNYFPMNEEPEFLAHSYNLQEKDHGHEKKPRKKRKK